ncbi:MAG TPA: (Fe-S)-binding protein [Cytophagaceae bacterium]|jgi:heterodisulfide reductase subunit C|nr:(Fe-S)-binding protein [Cytophagaceae bacterium]
MAYIPQILFVIAFGIANYFIFKSVMRIRKNILMGKDVNRSDRPSERLKMMLLVAFGQKKMFKKFIPAMLHLFIYLGFLIVNLEMLEIMLDGIFGTHRLFLPLLGSLYPYLITIFEFFAVAVIVTCSIFLIRRSVLKVNRFNGEEMTRKPKIDATIILVSEILLMTAFLTMNAADLNLQALGGEHFKTTGDFFFSGLLKNALSGVSASGLIVIERVCWWFHILGVLLFANYVLWDSKHLHIFLAFPNTYYSKLEPAGQFVNMPEVTHEVKLMLNIPVENPEVPVVAGKFGAKDVMDLTWKNLLEAYTCTECGRCTQQCPANITGKKLSPRKIMMDTRDRVVEVGLGKEINGNEFNDGKSLLGDYISEEEILACTTCNACVEACPVNINPVDIIMKLRQYKMMEESQMPQSWQMMVSNIENNFAPWKFSPADRFNWKDKL